MAMDQFPENIEAEKLKNSWLQTTSCTRALSTLLCRILLVFFSPYAAFPGSHSTTMQRRTRLHKDKKNPAQYPDISALT
ncbi:MAG: hypothetical protein CSA32_00465 [Desulfobulbus propionicus]|nr:MAG: hypothetical protein CSA32_00465 [Desulfobulbus propionicus]